MLWTLTDDTRHHCLVLFAAFVSFREEPIDVTLKNVHTFLTVVAGHFCGNRHDSSLPRRCAGRRQVGDRNVWGGASEISHSRTTNLDV
jgi:hypothetical protein